MAKQEITLMGLDGHEDHLIYDAANGQVGDSLEECARSLFPQEGETTPRLRFKGFEGEWACAKLGDLFTERVENNINGEMLSVTMNQGIIKASENGRFDNSNSDKSHYKVVKVNDIAYNSMRMWQGASGCSPYDGIVSPAYTVVTPVEGIDPQFFACLFKTPNAIKLFRLSSQGLTTDTWNLKYPAFSKIIVSYPHDIEEQKAIASFFHRLDAQIALRKNQYERLQQMKAACLDSMFPRGKEIAPPIRFNGFEEDWVVASLSDCLMVNKERNINGVYTKNDVLSVSDDFGVVNQIELLGRSFAGKSVVNYRVLRHGDIVYTKSPLKIKPFGIIKVNEGKDGIVSTLYAVYTAKEGVLPQFINYYFAPSYRMNSYIHPLVNKGAKNDMKVSDENVLKGKICIPPSLDEQKCIASFFLKLDSHISTEQQRLERLTQMKTACLRSMFPQNGGGNLPLIRFKGFDEEWTLYSLSQILKVNSGMDYKKLNSGNIPVYGTGGYMLSVDKSISDRDAIGIGRKGTIDVPQLLRSPFWTIDTLFFMTIKNDFDLEFIYALCQTINWKAYDESTGVPSLSKNNIEKIEVYVPKIEEQRCIASFFRSLDKKILLQTQLIEKLKQMKAACLSKMIA